MIDIGRKESVQRMAVSEGFIKLKRQTIKAIEEKEIKKGDVEEASKVSGILGAKATPTLIPHCHSIPLESVSPSFKIEKDGIRVACEVKARYKTGVEMESLSCVNSMLLTIWDMVKYLEKNTDGQYKTTEIFGVKVLKKKKNEEG